MSKTKPTLVQFVADKQREHINLKGHGITDIQDIKALEKEYNETYPKEEEKVVVKETVETPKESVKEVKKK